MSDGAWLSLMIGNSRLHWALFEKDDVLEVWDSGHLGKEEELLEGNRRRGHYQTVYGKGPPPENGNGAPTFLLLEPRKFRVASVVPKELDRWLKCCPGISPFFSRDAVDGVGEYPTLGVDRALALRGAARERGWPVMVVDCGSALTFTACDQQGKLAGGAILPGVRLQLSALGTRTAQLPSDVVLPEKLPPRWAMETAGGIQAGVMWTIVAGIHSFITDRWKIDPDATVVFTGGDGQVLHKAILDYWQAEEPEFARFREKTRYIGEVIHWGIASLALETAV